MSAQTVRYNRLATQGVWLWLGKSNVAALVVALIIIIASINSTGILGLIITAPLWGFLTFAGLRTKFGVPLPVLLWRDLMFQLRKSAKATKHLSRPEKAPVVAALGRLNLPGQTSYLQLWETPHGVNVVFDPQLQTASITCMLYGADFLAASQPDKDVLVESWARVKGAWTLNEFIERISVLERTAPGSVESARTYYRTHATADMPELRESYEESLASAEAQVTRHRTQVTVTFNTRTAREAIKAHGGGKVGLLAFIELQIAATESSLQQCGFVNLEWMNSRVWAGTGRAILDPEYAPVLEMRDGTDLAGVDPLAVGPMSFEEHRTYVIADSGFHRTFWIHEWPRHEAHPGFTQNVVFATMPDGRAVRHILNIVEAPVLMRVALKRIAEAKKSWRVNETARIKIGRESSAADHAEWDELVAQDAALASGRGEYRFSGYLTVSAMSLLELDAASMAMRSALSNAGLEPQILYAQQAEALMLNAYPSGRGMK